MEELYYLIYVSYGQIDDSDTSIVELLKTSRRNNSEKNITGLLLFANNRFIQILEGTKEEVTRLFKKIENDPRHKDPLVLLEGTLSSRNFDQWDMGFQKISDVEIKETTGLNSIDKLINEIKSYHPALHFLKLFCDKNV